MFAFLFAKTHLFFFGAACDLPGGGFFFFPRWWKYLEGQQDTLGKCVPKVNFPNDIWLIGLVVLEMLTRLAGFIAVVSIILAGIQLIISEGNSEKGVAARQRLTNSLIGLAIAAIAATVVGFIGNQVATGGGGALPHTAANQDAINTIFNIIFVILGALTFLFVVIAGFRFVNSRGDTAKLADTRRQLVYAVLGLILVATASAIVNFVVKKL
jgi:hypothetical protein